MSYIPEDDENIIKDLLRKKEFQLLNLSQDTNSSKTELEIIPPFAIEEYLNKGIYLSLRSYQTFVSNFINPNTPYSRLLMKWETGVGKTIGALSIAMNFINVYQKNEDVENFNIGSVFILGFTQEIFKNELLRFPQFGFVSDGELEEIEKLKIEIKKGNMDASEQLKKIQNNLKKKLSSRTGNGFFQFWGYKELVNSLFIKNQADINISDLSDEEIKMYLKEEKIILNNTLINNFKNSLIICDEIHNVYNSIEKNNWGSAIQSILDSDNSIRAIFLSATPITNNPTELIDIMNLLLPKHLYSEIKKEEFFTDDNELKNVSKLEKILQGRVSFIRDNNPSLFPSKKFVGEKIPGIPYLKFIRCPMSKFHFQTYKKFIKNYLNEIYTNKNIINNTDTKSDNVLKGDNIFQLNQIPLSNENQYLVDFAIPQPNKTFRDIGLFKTKEIKSLLNINSQNLIKKSIYYDPKDNRIKGDFIKINLKDISSKYYKLIELIKENIKTQVGKIFIYHNIIHMSGVLFIEEVLLNHGFIDIDSSPNDNTICVICGNTKKNHIEPENIISESIEVSQTSLKPNKHYFQPVKFISIYSTKSQKEINSLINRFNSINNTEGYECLIILGGKIMKESKTLKAIRNIYITSRPDNISSLIQIMGRGIRLGTHLLLPKEKRNVNINLLTNSIPKNEISEYGNLSYEEQKYKEKIEVYKIIQKIDKIIHSNAIDAEFNKNIIWKSEQKKNESRVKFDKTKSVTSNDNLDILDFKPSIEFKFKPRDLNLSTFNRYYQKYEVEQLSYIIKRLFLEVSTVWTLEDLWDYVKNPPFHIELNTNILSKELFRFTLSQLLYYEDINYIEPEINYLSGELIEKNLISSLRNYNDKNIMIPNLDNPNKFQKMVITQINKFYVLKPKDEKFYNYDMFYRYFSQLNLPSVNIKKYLEYDIENNYSYKKEQFINKWKNTDINNLEEALNDFGIEFHKEFIENTISYIFNIWTNPIQKLSPNHNFYFKMLYYYDLQNIIIWGNEIEKDISNFQKSLLLKKYPHIINKTKNEDTSIEHILNNLTKSDPNWISTGMVKKYNKILNKSLELFDGIIKSSLKSKIPINYIPIGHYINTEPRIYNFKDEVWEDSIELIKKNFSEYNENDIIIGYYEKPSTSMKIKFKIRTPLHLEKKHKDTRLIEKGMVCSSRSKNNLRELVKSLKIKYSPKDNVDTLCNLIKTELLYRELKERQMKTNIKWFYFLYQNRPEQFLLD